MQSKKQLLTDLLDSKTGGTVTDLRYKFNRSLDDCMGKDWWNFRDPIWQAVWDTVRWNVAERVYHKTKGLL